MSPERNFGIKPETYKIYSDDWFLNEYLKYGSVEEALKYNINLPISAANYHRLVKRRGIIKGVGRRETSLSEALYFFAEKAIEPTLPLEKLYKTMPYGFRTSIATLYRVYDLIKCQTPRREAVALLIKKDNDNDSVLVGKETKTSLKIGRFKGDYSIPMGFSNNFEDPSVSVLRVLQREFSTRLAISGDLSPEGALSTQLLNSMENILSYDILDVRIGLYSLTLPEFFNNNLFDSHNLIDHKFIKIDEIEYGKFRLGVPEMISCYMNSDLNNEDNVPHFVSSLNLAILNS